MITSVCTHLACIFLSLNFSVIQGLLAAGGDSAKLVPSSSSCLDEIYDSLEEASTGVAPGDTKYVATGFSGNGYCIASRIWTDGEPLQNGTHPNNTGYTADSCKSLCTSLQNCKYVSFENANGGQCHMTEDCPQWATQGNVATWAKDTGVQTLAVCYITLSS